MSLSLSRFFDRTADATLDSCDREKIHLCGTIQPGTGLLVLDPEDRCITGASENMPVFFDRPVEDILGQPLDAISAGIAEQISELEESSVLAHTILDAQIETEGAVYDVVPTPMQVGCSSSSSLTTPHCRRSFASA